jgi:hypothetical protein
MSNEPVELFCTQDTDTQEWLVWFPHPLGGMKVLETFDNEVDARKYHQEQLDSIDLNEG